MLEILDTNFPKSKDILALLTIVYYQRSYYDRVIQFGEQALLLDEDNREIQALVGISYVRADDIALRNNKKAVEMLWPLRDDSIEGVNVYLKRALTELNDPRASLISP